MLPSANLMKPASLPRGQKIACVGHNFATPQVQRPAGRDGVEADGVGPEFAVEVVAAVTAAVLEHVVAAAAISFIFAGAASEDVVVVATL